MSTIAGTSTEREEGGNGRARLLTIATRPSAVRLATKMASAELETTAADQWDAMGGGERGGGDRACRCAAQGWDVEASGSVDGDERGRG
jgi:hypothetical protein